MTTGILLYIMDEDAPFRIANAWVPFQEEEEGEKGVGKDDDEVDRRTFGSFIRQLN
jgi:hypothetical protein